jgi:hypothetical protein
MSKRGHEHLSASRSVTTASTAATGKPNARATSSMSLAV